jgi:hypothetical protein
VPPAGTDFASERLEKLGAGAGDGHQLAPPALTQRLTDTFANDVARANQSPGK